MAVKNSFGGVCLAIYDDGTNYVIETRSSSSTSFTVLNQRKIPDARIGEFAEILKKVLAPFGL